MLSKTVEVRNSTGLHASGGLSGESRQKYSCKVTLHYEGNDINATSMLNIMRAGIKAEKRWKYAAKVMMKTRQYKLSLPYFATASVKLNN